MRIAFSDQPRLKLIGYSPDSPERILARIMAGARPSQLRGDFVLVAEGIDRDQSRPSTVFVSTVVGAVPYYLARTATGFVDAWSPAITVGAVMQQLKSMEIRVAG